MGRNTGSQKHTHKYHRGPNKMWACALDDCTHYMPKNVEWQLEGKKSICWRCGEEFRLDSDSMLHNRPFCQVCKMKDAGMSPDNIAEYLIQQEAKKQELPIAAKPDEVIKKDKDGNEIEVFDPLS
jgi:hypothetical protein